MATIASQFQHGYYVTCTGGTATPGALLNSAGGFVLSPTASLRIVGISCGGTATTDIVTVNDGAGNFLFKSSPIAANQPGGIQLGGPIRVNGLQVGFSGGTGGYCVVYIPSGIY